MLLPAAASTGLIAVAISMVMKRTSTALPWVEAVFWVGFVVMIAPLLWRLVGLQAGRVERIALSSTLGVLLYVVKLLRDPVTFVMSDEFTHLNAAQQMLATHSVFPAVSVSGAHVAYGYPGLQIVAVTLHDLTGLSIFLSGLITIGFARLVAMWAAFALFERITGSGYTAGLGAALFTANSNFLFWSTQFSYESLALPLFLTALLLATVRAREDGSRRAATAGLAVVTLAIAATHHVTLAALAAVLWGLSLLSLRPRWRSWRGFELALGATALAVAWFLAVAPGTRNYLGFVFNQAFSSVKDVGSSGSQVNAPFTSHTASLTTPLSEIAVAVLGVMLLGLGVLATLLRARRIKALANPMGILLVLGALVCLAFYPVRALPGAWETANRAQEFTFTGIAFVLACGLSALGASRLRRRRVRVLITLGLAVVIVGGAIESWPASLRTSPPLEVRVAGDRTIWPQAYAVAGWARSELARQATFLADQSTGSLLSVQGAHYTNFGFSGSPDALTLQDPTLPYWQASRLRSLGVDYAVLDRRQIANNNQAGLFFPLRADPSGGAGYFPAGARAKFDALPSASRVYDSGDITVFDVSAVLGKLPPCAAVGLQSLTDGVACQTATATITSARGEVAGLVTSRVRLVGASVQPLSGGLLLNAIIQLQSLHSGDVAALSGSRSAYLIVGDRRFYPLSRVPGRTDTITPRSIVRHGRQLEGSLSFELTGAAAAAAQAGRARLYVPSLGHPTSLGLFRLTSPEQLP